MTTAPEREDWIELKPAIAQSIVDARLQAHHAVQLASAIGECYLPPSADDSHGNLCWDRKHRALESRETRALSHSVRAALQLRELTLLVLVNESVGQRIPLDGINVMEAESALRGALEAAGVEGRRLRLTPNEAIPTHPVAGGAAFDASRTDDFTELANWFDNADSVLGALQKEWGSSEVRCWPHHFDIATLITVGPERTVGVGLSPGDVSYREPYFYVNAWPAPSANTLPDPGTGFWNRDGWFGAVLPGSRLVEGSGQHAQVTEFLKSAVSACSALVRQ